MNNTGHPRHSLADDSQINPALASLFASSAGPISIPKKTKPQNTSARATSNAIQQAENNPVDGPIYNTTSPAEPSPDARAENVVNHSRRKRKSRSQEQEIEDVYFKRLSRDTGNREAHGIESQPRKRLRRDNSISAGSVDVDSDNESKISENIDSSDAGERDEVIIDGTGAGAEELPLHESLVSDGADSEIEKASRTVFLGNVSNLAISSKSARRQLVTHISTIFQSPSLPKGTHKIQSLRFRSTAYASTVPKKGAFAKKDLMDATTKSTNAYVVYTSQSAAREAARTLNGTVILDRHLRADLVAHPAKIDHRRCVFVGNLGFVDDESSIDAADEADHEHNRSKRKKSKNKEPGDVEEGLWREFGKAGVVESVRVIRDSKTRVGKGFAYVQFMDENAVEAALLFDGKKFPPLLPRKLRVSRAKSIKRNATNSYTQRGNLIISKNKGSLTDKNVNMNPQRQSLAGRAGRLLGKAGAAAMKSKPSKSRAGSIRDSRIHPGKSGINSRQIKAPESFIFEGHRASNNQKPSGLKLTSKGKTKGSSKKPGRPKTRSANRAAAWKANGSKSS